MGAPHGFPGCMAETAAADPWGRAARPPTGRPRPVDLAAGRPQPRLSGLLKLTVPRPGGSIKPCGARLPGALWAINKLLPHQRSARRRRRLDGTARPRDSGAATWPQAEAARAADQMAAGPASRPVPASPGVGAAFWQHPEPCPALPLRSADPALERDMKRFNPGGSVVSRAWASEVAMGDP